MKYASMALIVVWSLASWGIALTAQGIADTDLGLSKTSVFATPSPETFSYGKASPGDSQNLPRAFPGAPPQIPHEIDSFLPLVPDNNMCLDCHDQPEKIGKPQAGGPTPIPASHYTDLRHAPGRVMKKLSGARFICTQCHVPQANVKPLVENVF
jgi:cytochrome c-type protein NapB